MQHLIQKPQSETAVIVPERRFYQELEHAVIKAAGAEKIPYSEKRVEVMAELNTGAPVTVSATQFTIKK
jgi:hypothetical protein